MAGAWNLTYPYTYTHPSDMARTVRLAHMQLASPVSQKTFPVRVGPAGDKGVGVFATRDIKRGETCCWYDGVVCPDQYVATFTTGVFGYTIQAGGVHLAGFRTQLRPGGCAQLCNDASTEYDEADLKYLKHVNVESRDFENGVAFVAKKPIKRGQELLYSYGSDYWRTRKERQLHSMNEMLLVWAWTVGGGKLKPHEIERACNAYSSSGEEMDHYRNRYQLAIFFLESDSLSC